MDDRVNKFKNGKMNSSELLDFKKDVGMMSDEELSRYLDESGSQFSFTSSEIDS